MRQGSLLFFTALIFGACTGVSPAQQPKVPPEMWEKAKAEGMVRVLVQLNVPTKSLDSLDNEQALAQRKMIATVQKELLAELTQTTHKVGRLLENIPVIALEAGVDALTVLERSNHVTKVTEERVFKPFQK